MKRLIALPNQKITLEDILLHMWGNGNVEFEKAEEQDTQYRKSPPEATTQNSAGNQEMLKCNPWDMPSNFCFRFRLKTQCL